MRGWGGNEECPGGSSREELFPVTYLSRCEKKSGRVIVEVKVTSYIKQPDPKA
jgi:hypothetical protein